jgi:hypothetical protein
MIAVMILQLSPESPVLEGGEEGVQFGQRGAVRGLQLLHGAHPPGEFALEFDGGNWDYQAAQTSHADPDSCLSAHQILRHPFCGWLV